MQRENKTLAFLCVITFFMYLGSFMRLPIIPLYASSLGASYFQVGLINSSFMIVAALLAIPFGSLSDRFGRRLLILAGLLINGAASLLYYFSTSPEQMMLISLFAGFGIAAFGPAIASFVGDVSAAKKLGQSYGWFTASMQLGMASGPALGGAVASRLELPAVFIFSSAVILFASAAAGLLPSPAARGAGRVKAALAELRKIRLVAACWAAVFCIAFAFGVFQPFFPLYARDIGLSIFAIGVVFAAQSLSNALARIPAGYLSDRVGRRSPFILGGMLVFAATIALIPFFKSFEFLLGAAAFIGLTMGITTTAISASLAEHANGERRGVAMGGFSASLYGGFAISSALSGAVISSFGYAYGFAFASLFCVLGATIFYSLAKEQIR